MHPGFGVRIGEQPYFSLAAFNSPIPGITSKLVEAGIGMKFDGMGIWYGAASNFLTTYATVRYSRHWKFGGIGLNLQWAPRGEGGFDYALAISSTVGISP